MSRDTWSADSGIEVGVDRLADLWGNAIKLGATGLTISGGEPADQPAALLSTIVAARNSAPPALRDSLDILVYTGYELADFNVRVPGALDLVDVLITGPYVIAQPTSLIWRGSANQQMHLLSPLAMERYARFLDQRSEKPMLQVMVDDQDIWYLGIPRAGDLSRIESALRNDGVITGGASWRR
jgi:anaerobic ribonucleoside-triphosphate reductase activating protein